MCWLSLCTKKALGKINKKNAYVLSKEKKTLLLTLPSQMPNLIKLSLLFMLGLLDNTGGVWKGLLWTPGLGYFLPDLPILVQNFILKATVSHIVSHHLSSSDIQSLRSLFFHFLGPICIIYIFVDGHFCMCAKVNDSNHS